VVCRHDCLTLILAHQFQPSEITRPRDCASLLKGSTITIDL